MALWGSVFSVYAKKCAIPAITQTFHQPGVAIDTCWYWWHFWEEENGWDSCACELLPYWSCTPWWICCSLQLPRLYWAHFMMCIRWRQIPRSPTSCIQHMSHASRTTCIQEIDTLFWNVSGQGCTFIYILVIFKTLMGIVMILSPCC